MPSPRFLVTALTCAGCLTLAACATTPGSTREPQSVLDERTGVTLNAVSEPIVFTRVQQNASSSVHEYVTLVALEKDNAGKYTQLLLMYRWSVSFKGPLSPPPENAGRLIIHCDDRDLELQPLEQIPVDLSLKALMVPDGAYVRKYAYLTDFDTLRQIASSHELSVRLPQEDDSMTMALSRDGRHALSQLVAQLNGS
jgi:hypothetical protein